MEYAHGRGEAPLAWLPARGSVSLCERHGEVLEEVLGPGGVLRLARLA
jgi:hypothetical protein